MCNSFALLACCCRLHFAVKSLVDYTVTAVLNTKLWLFTIAILLVQLLGEKLEELVRILLFCRYKILERFFLRYPEA